MNTPKEKGDILAARIEKVTTWLQDTSPSLIELKKALAEYRAPLPILTPEQIAAGWVEWHGGECPVWGGSKVKVILRNGTQEENTGRHFEGDGPSMWKHEDDTLSACEIIAYLPDPCEALKKAHAEGKTVEENVAGTFRSGAAHAEYWQTKTDSDWTMPPERYRVKPEPEKWAAEKAAFAAGKTIEASLKDHETPIWVTVSRAPGEDFIPQDYCIYRVAPEPVLVELGPEDVKCGDLISFDDGKSELMVVGKVDGKIKLPSGTYSLEQLKEWKAARINRNDGLGFVPCSKPADAKEWK